MDITRDSSALAMKTPAEELVNSWINPFGRRDIYQGMLRRLLGRPSVLLLVAAVVSCLVFLYSASSEHWVEEEALSDLVV